MKTESAVTDRRRVKASAVVLVLLSLVVAVLYLIYSGLQPESAQTAAAATIANHELVSPALSDKSNISRLSVVGTIEARDTVSVIAPFDGVIKERSLAFDTEVEKGQPLLMLDATELRMRIQEAKVAMLKASKAVHELEDWERGGEVARAKRNLAQAQQQVEQTERKSQEAETLLRKGFIARSEYDGLVEQLSGFKVQVDAAASDLQATRERAGQSNREIARIEYEQAKAKYEDLAGSQSLAKIVSPRAGIVSKAQATSGQAPATLDVGSRVAKGQLLFNVALTDKLRIAAKVDEVDVVELTRGMPVEISIDSQDMPALQGRLIEVSAQAAQSATGSRSAVFDIKIDVPELNAQQRRRLRVGMSCNVSIGAGKPSLSPASDATFDVKRQREGS